VEANEERIRFENYLVQRGKSPGDYDFLIEHDIPRQSDTFPVSGRVLIREKKDDRSKIYRFGSGYDWWVEFSADIERDLI